MTDRQKTLLYLGRRAHRYWTAYLKADRVYAGRGQTTPEWVIAMGDRAAELAGTYLDLSWLLFGRWSRFEILTLPPLASTLVPARSLLTHAESAA